MQYSPALATGKTFSTGVTYQSETTQTREGEGEEREEECCSLVFFFAVVFLAAIPYK